MSSEPSKGAPGVSVLLRGIDTLAAAGAMVAATLLVLLTGMIIVEILLGMASKAFPSLPPGLPNTWEYSAYLMGAAFMLGTGQAMRVGAHIRMTALVERLGPDRQRVLDIVASCAGIVAAGIMSWALISFAWRAAIRGQTSESFVPLWIPLGAMAIGLIILTLQIVARLLRLIINERRGEILQTTVTAE